MDKLVAVTGPDSPEKAKAYISAALEGSASTEEEQRLIVDCAVEICTRIAEASPGGQLVVSLDKGRSGISMQFMHTGPIFNPCPTAADSLTRRHMDEISFEFKYGRNVLTVFRRTDKQEKI